jgi:hypothetical protein
MSHHLLGGYVGESRDSMPHGTKKHGIETADDLLFNGVVGCEPFSKKAQGRCMGACDECRVGGGSAGGNLGRGTWVDWCDAWDSTECGMRGVQNRQGEQSELSISEVRLDQGGVGVKMQVQVGWGFVGGRADNRFDDRMWEPRDDVFECAQHRSKVAEAQAFERRVVAFEGLLLGEKLTVTDNKSC